MPRTRRTEARREKGEHRGDGEGVWATQYDVSGIYMWFWPRESIPATINDLPLDISTWGPPTASYPNSSSCPMTQFFTPQQIVLDITLCGDWAGLPVAYNATCQHAGPTGSCYLDNVVGPGSSAHYDNAYFEVSYVKAFTTGAPGATATSQGAALHTSKTPAVRLGPVSVLNFFPMLLIIVTIVMKFMN